MVILPYEILFYTAHLFIEKEKERVKRRKEGKEREKRRKGEVEKEM